MRNFFIALGIFLSALLLLQVVQVFIPFNTVSLQNTAPDNASTSTAHAQLPLVATSSTVTTATTTAKTPTKSGIVSLKPLSLKLTQPITPTPAQAPTNEPAPDFDAINDAARAAIVNILCTANGDTLSPVSGTGVVISPDGVILTNAHVAEFFLLQNYLEPNYVQCVIRTGSPATARYNAELVYISPEWVRANKSLLKESVQTGTGEDDFAFLKITHSLDGSPLPASFPYLAADTSENITQNEPVVLASYPAGFLGGITIAEDLNAASAVSTIEDYFTFGQNTIDLIDVGGTIVAQRGASGGAVVSGEGKLVGIISTSSLGDTTASRDLNAITLGYINRTLIFETGLSVSQFLSQDTSAYATQFNQDVAPGLSALIEDALTSTTPAQ